MMSSTFSEFVWKWKAVRRPEHAVSKEQFLNLCRVLGFPEPSDADSVGELFALEKRVPATNPDLVFNIDKDGQKINHKFADAWLGGCFIWEYKSKGLSLENAYDQVMSKYYHELGSPPLVIVSDMHSFWVCTMSQGARTGIYKFDLKMLGENHAELPGGRTPQEVLYAAFYDPDYLRLDTVQPAFIDQATYKSWREQQYILTASFSPDIPLPPKWGLIGRDSLVVDMKEVLLKPSGTVALRGMAGVGKSAIPVALANEEELRKQFFGGVLWARLGKKANVLEQLIGWARALRMGEPEITRITSQSNADRNIAALSSAVSEAIGQKRMLLVIDDAWSMRDATYFKLGSRASYLLTTRLPAVAAGFASDVYEVKELEAGYGHELLQNIAPTAVQAEPTLVNDLVEAVYGLPLALVIVGGYLRIASSRGRARLIEDALIKFKQSNTRLTAEMELAANEEHPSRPDDRAISLTTSIDLSYDILNADEQAAFLSLSVLPVKPRNFTEESALAISEANTTTLDAVVNAGLVEDDGTNYAMHPLVRDYAHILIHEDDKASAHMSAVNYYFNRYVRDQQGRPPSNVVEVQHLLDAFEQMMGARQYALANNLLRGLSLPAKGLSRDIVLTELLNDWGECHILANLNESLISVPHPVLLEELGTEAYIGLLDNSASSFHLVGQTERGLELRSEALHLAEQEGIMTIVPTLLSNMGTDHVARGEYGKALAYHARSLNLRTEAGDEPGRVFNLQAIATIYDEQGNLERAADYYFQAAVVAWQCHDQRRVAKIVASIGSICFGLADRRTELVGAWVNLATQFYSLALSYAKDYNLAHLESEVLDKVSSLYAFVGDSQRRTDHPDADNLLDAAIKSQERGLEQVRLKGDVRATGTRLGNLANAHAAKRTPLHLKKAVIYYVEAINVAVSVYDPEAESRHWVNMGRTYLDHDKRLAVACCLKYERARSKIKYSSEGVAPSSDADDIRAAVGGEWAKLQAEVQQWVEQEDWRPQPLGEWG